MSGAEPSDVIRKLVAQRAHLKSLIREALSKGAERRCPWCWTVSLRGKHAPDCRAMAALLPIGTDQ